MATTFFTILVIVALPNIICNARNLKDLDQSQPERRERKVGVIKINLFRNSIILSLFLKFCRGGECVPFYLCNNGSVITDGEGIIDFRSSFDSYPESNECKETFETCCAVPAKKSILSPVNEGCGYIKKDDFRIAYNGGSQFL